MASRSIAEHDTRATARDEVHHRTRAVAADGRWLPLVVVNMSRRGLMARCEAPIRIGDRLRVQLPMIGDVVAEVRWALGGRIGCELDDTLPASSYYVMLHEMLRSN